MIDQARLAQSFKWLLNPFMLLTWRLGLGRWINIWPAVLGQYMVIGHTGRKSGLRRQTPVNFAIVDDAIYCMAGFGTSSDWYRNVMADPHVEVWLSDGWWDGVAEVVVDEETCNRVMRPLLVASAFAAPLFAGINPRTITDAQLQEMARTYPLLRIHRTEARTGPDGPGDLAWVWPLLALILLVMPHRKRGRR